MGGKKTKKGSAKKGGGYLTVRLLLGLAVWLMLAPGAAAVYGAGEPHFLINKHHSTRFMPGIERDIDNHDVKGMALDAVYGSLVSLKVGHHVLADLGTLNLGLSSRVGSTNRTEGDKLGVHGGAGLCTLWSYLCGAVVYNIGDRVIRYSFLVDGAQILRDMGVK